MATAVLLALALGCSAPVAVAPSNPTSAADHVRSDEADLRALVHEGVTKSALFRSLVARLGETDVVVYFRTSFIKGGLGGFVPHRVAAHDDGRYLVAVVTKGGSRNRRIGVIAHELQHALEIGREPQAGRTQSVADLFARIGTRSGLMNSYETAEAVDVERAVRQEHARAHDAACLPTSEPRALTTGDSKNLAEGYVAFVSVEMPAPDER